MNTNENMTLDDAIAIDVVDGSAGSPSEGGADQTQADLPKESKVEIYLGAHLLQIVT